MSSGLPIHQRLKEKTCGVWVVDLRDGSLAGTLRFTQGVHEIFSVHALATGKYPEVLGSFDKGKEADFVAVDWNAGQLAMRWHQSLIVEGATPETIEQAAQDTRISPRFLEALEAELDPG